MKNRTFNKLTTLTLATSLTIMPFATSLSAYASIEETSITTNAKSSALDLDAIVEDSLGLSDMTLKDRIEKRQSIQAQPTEITETTERSTGFVLSEWVYETSGSQILLKEYIGTKRDLYIPGQYNGKQVVVNDLYDLPYTMTSIKFAAVNGKKVKVNTSDFSGAFGGCIYLKTADLSGLDTSNATTMRQMFYGANDLTSLNLSGVNTANVTDMSSMFYGTISLTELDLSSFNTSKVTTMAGMFARTDRLKSLDLSNFNTSRVTDMSSMFYKAESLTSLNISSFRTSRVTNMTMMFSGARSLTSLNLKHFNTSNVKSMWFMFSNMRNLSSLNVTSFNTSKVTQMDYMFQNTNNLISLDLNSFKLSNQNLAKLMFNCDNCAVPLVYTATDKYLKAIDFTDTGRKGYLFSYNVPGANTTKISGKGLPGATVGVYLNNTRIGVAKVDNSGNYSLTIPKQPSGTTLSFRIAKTGYHTLARNVNVLNTFKTFTYTTPSAFSTTITGKGEPGAKVGAYLNGTRLGITTVDSKGNYTLSIPKQKAGTILSVRMAKSGYETLAKNVTVTPGVEQDFPTKLTYTTPTTVSTTVKGKGEPGALVGAYLNGKRLGITTIDSKGNYTLTIPKQKAGTVLSIRMAKTGYKLQAYNVTVQEAKFSTNLTYSTPTVSSTTIKGKGEPGALVGAYLNGKRLGITTIDAKGNYTLTIPKQKAGTVLSVRMAKTGYKLQAYDVTVLNEFKTFTIKKATTSSVTLYGTGLPGANVKAFVNGKEISSLTSVNSKGNYKITIPKQKAGTVVQIKMAKSGYKTISKNITIVKG